MCASILNLLFGIVIFCNAGCLLIHAEISSSMDRDRMLPAIDEVRRLEIGADGDVYMRILGMDGQIYRFQGRLTAPVKDVCIIRPVFVDCLTLEEVAARTHQHVIRPRSIIFTVGLGSRYAITPGDHVLAAAISNKSLCNDSRDVLVVYPVHPSREMQATDPAFLIVDHARKTRHLMAYQPYQDLTPGQRWRRALALAGGSILDLLTAPVQLPMLGILFLIWASE